MNTFLLILTYPLFYILITIPLWYFLLYLCRLWFGQLVADNKPRVKFTKDEIHKHLKIGIFGLQDFHLKIGDSQFFVNFIIDSMVKDGSIIKITSIEQYKEIWMKQGEIAGSKYDDGDLARIDNLKKITDAYVNANYVKEIEEYYKKI